MTEVTNSETQQPQQAPTGIQVGDMQAVVNIIDLACTRGAFRANELSQVGAVTDKINAFLKQIADQQKANEEKAEAKAEAPAEAKAEAPAEATTDKQG
jgi:hypothetical protein|tara:strand:- start:9179 stop:9472 length:294 start_codon:yes stop_codon:yes gene_type:complete